MRAASEGGVAQRGKDAEDKELVHRAMVDREAVAVLYGRYRDRLLAGSQLSLDRLPVRSAMRWCTHGGVSGTNSHQS
jgi:hypothetical protein